VADLIVLLLATLTSLLAPGVREADLEKQVAAAVLAKPPVPIAAVKVDAAGVSSHGVKSIEFDLSDLLLDPLLIADACIAITHVSKVPQGKLAILGIAWSADITEEALTAALNAHTSSLKSAQVKLEEEGITLSGKYKTRLFPVPFSVKGQLVVENDTQLVFRIDKSRMSGVPVPGPLNRIIEREVNPVYDLAKFAKRNEKDIARAKEQLSYTFKLQVEEITPGSGHIRAAGKA